MKPPSDPTPKIVKFLRRPSVCRHELAVSVDMGGALVERLCLSCQRTWREFHGEPSPPARLKQPA